jgi:hypothetical protein
MEEKRKKREKQDQDKIVVYSRRPNRAETINDEDILNLRIALHSTESVSEFLNSME